MNNESSHDNIIEAKLSRFENIIEEKNEGKEGDYTNFLGRGH